MHIITQHAINDYRQHQEDKRESGKKIAAMPELARIRISFNGR